jgi:hypothetical protein
MEEGYDINDPSNLVGIADFIDNSNVKLGVNPKDILNTVMKVPNNSNADYNAMYDAQVKKYTKEYGLGQPTEDIFGSRRAVPGNSAMAPPLLPSSLPPVQWPQQYGQTSQYRQPNQASLDLFGNSSDDLDLDDIFSVKGQQVGMQSQTTSPFSYFDVNSNRKLEMATEEQLRGRYVNDLINTMTNPNDHQILSEIQRMEESTKKTQLIIDVNNLREGLSHYSGEIDINKYPKPSDNMSIESLLTLKKELLMLDQTLSSSGITEEVIIAGLKGLGKLFDGTREILGVRPYLKNYHTVAQLQLKKMKYMTSKAYTNIFGNNGAEPNPYLEIGLRLLPSLVLHTGMNKAPQSPNPTSSPSGTSSTTNSNTNTGSTNQSQSAQQPSSQSPPEQYDPFNDGYTDEDYNDDILDLNIN